jgi:hypothetical protein
MPAKACLGKPGVCRLGGVEFIYTSVSRDDTLSLVDTARSARQVRSSVRRSGATSDLEVTLGVAATICYRHSAFGGRCAPRCPHRGPPGSLRGD